MLKKVLAVGMALPAIVAAAAVTASSIAFSIAQAQTGPGPQFLITWSAAKSYAPIMPGGGFYAGKILPNQQSPVAASLELISRQGRPIGISGQTIYWYLNDTLIGGGIGVQRIAFRPFGEAPNTATLRVELPDYPGGILVHEITIPVVTPQVVISAPYPQGRVAASPATVEALPYFWNTTSSASLGYAWSVNDHAVSDAENPQSLQINLPANTPTGFALAVTLNAQNAYDSTAAAANATLTYQP